MTGTSSTTDRAAEPRSEARRRLTVKLRLTRGGLRSPRVKLTLQ